MNFFEYLNKWENYLSQLLKRYEDKNGDYIKYLRQLETIKNINSAIVMSVDLFNTIKNNQINFILSNWYSNKYRNNDVIINNFENNQFTIVKIDHFYHVGGKEANRNSIIECLIKNKDE